MGRGSGAARVCSAECPPIAAAAKGPRRRRFIIGAPFCCPAENVTPGWRTAATTQHGNGLSVMAVLFEPRSSLCDAALWWVIRHGWRAPVFR